MIPAPWCGFTIRKSPSRGTLTPAWWLRSHNATRDGAPGRHAQRCGPRIRESQSRYLDHNIQTYATDPKGVKTDETIPVDETGHFFLTGSGFADTTIKWSINGHIYGNMPMMAMKTGASMSAGTW